MSTSGKEQQCPCDAPCDFTDPEVPTCPTPKHTCGRVTTRRCVPLDNHYCPSVIDCGGVKASTFVCSSESTVYLMWIIRVHRHRPKIATPQDRNGMVCYGVETREPTSIYSEYTSTKDMEDPVFYSTCYTREATRNRWIKFPRTFPPGDFVFGDQCIDCKSFDESSANLNSGDLQGRRMTRWLPAPRCADCLGAQTPMNFSRVGESYPHDGTMGDQGSGKNNGMMERWAIKVKALARTTLAGVARPSFGHRTT